MLVHTHNHLIPPSSDGPSVLSSPTTSTYIPDLPYDDDFSRSLVVPSDSPRTSSNRRDRRMRTAPYTRALSVNTPPVQSQHSLHKPSPGQNVVSLHYPRPIPYFDLAQAFDNVSAVPQVHPALAFTPGAHGTILGPFEMPTGHSTVPNAAFDELTATQMAYFQTCLVPPQAPLLPLTVPSSSTYAQPSQNRNFNSRISQIQVPRVPSIPQAPNVLPPPQVLDLDSSARRPIGVPHLPDAIPPETSQMHIKPSGKLEPPSDTFPTPVELLGELSLRDAEAAEKDSRRAERRKVQLMHEAEKLGFTPTDPDTISTHDKKRLYLDCLEQYVIYLHKQLRLAGHEPVPIERVSSGRGLTSRSIRTTIVHLKNTTAKLHAERREAELKYDELRAQLGEDADMTAPSFMPPSALFQGINACTPKTGMQHTIQSPTAAPIASSNSNASKNINNDMKQCMNGTHRYSVTVPGNVDPEPLTAPDCSA